MSKLRSVSLFSRDAVEASVPRSSGLAVAEARWRLKSWGSQVELAEAFERVAGLSHLLDPDVLSLAIQPGRGRCCLRG